MPETEEILSPEEILAEIKAGLESSEADVRLDSMDKLSNLNYSSVAILQALEKLAVKDGSERVQVAALDALDSPVHRQIFSKKTTMPQSIRQLLVAEIRHWEEDELIGTELANTLEKRYAFDFEQKAADKKAADAPSSPLEAPKAPEPKRSLGQVLFSESSIKIALYLGAFFVIAAAAIFAAAIESLRLPILLFFTAIFGGGSLILKKRLPQPSFTLFIVFSVLLPINFSVIAETLSLKGFGNNLYWMFVYLLMAGVWTFATWFFTSRFFSLTAFVSSGIAFVQLGHLFKDSPLELYLFLLSFLGLAGIIGARFLEKWQDEKFAQPLFLTVQLYEIALLSTSIFIALFHYDDAHIANGWWLASSATWLMGTAFYGLSKRFKEKQPFQIPFVASLMPLAWIFLNTFDPSESLQAIIFSFWGLLFILLGEILRTNENKTLQSHGDIFIHAALPLMVLSASLGIAENETLGFILTLGIFIIYLLQNFYRPRAWIWTTSLIAALAAYFLLFDLRFAQNWEIYAGFQLLIPLLALSVPELLISAPLPEKRSWRLPPIALGGLLLIFDTLGLLGASENDLSKAAFIFGIFSLLFLGYALRHKNWLAYIANLYAALTLAYTLRTLNAERWLFPFIGLSIFFYIIGWVLHQSEKNIWGKIYINSALTLAMLTALSALVEDSSLAKIIPVLLAAGIFTIEAFRKKNLWLGFPANFLYLMAYFMLLINFEVDQPQFYSVVAAGAGMLMHYLLVRAGSKKAAFITGMLSQLTLLSTTYFQLVGEEKFIYFVVIFMQAMLVLLYGVITRSKSMVITPIIFLVISVITVTLGLLEGWPTIFLIGCTGVFLIIFGIAALLLREQVAELREKLDDWNA